MIDLDKKQNKRASERMIHIRLDENIHRELKILAARTDRTVQGIVEDLIRNKIDSIDKTSRQK
jgi:predicted transcriptional regulator